MEFTKLAGKPYLAAMRATSESNPTPAHSEELIKNLAYFFCFLEHWIPLFCKINCVWRLSHVIHFQLLEYNVLFYYFHLYGYQYYL